MKPQELRRRLNGVISFPVTPFQSDYSLDLEGLRQNLRGVLQHPVCALVAAGGTGELYSLTPAEHRAVVEATVQEANGRVPVIAGVGFNQPLAAMMAEAAAAVGAQGILAFPPYYPNSDEEGLLAYYRGIGESTPLGMLIYSRDWFHPGPALVGRLTGISTLIAWKDGQGDMRRYQIIRETVGERLHWIGGAGDDLVPAYYALGIRTYTSSIANVAPRLSLRLHELAAAGQGQELAALMQELVIPLYGLRSRRKGYEVSVMKAMMQRLGLAAGPVRPPLVELRPEDLVILQELISRWRPWL